MSFFQKLCPAPFPPVSCSFPELYPGPQCCLYNLLEGQPENSWPLGGKYCIIFNPSRYSGLHFPCLLQHVNNSISREPARSGDRHTMPARTLLVAFLQGQMGFQGQCLPLWELALQAIWAQIPTTLLLKLQTYLPLD